MKNFLLLIIMVLLSTSCKAQNIYPLSNFETKNLKNNNYIKDTQNVLNPFVGTWEWTNGNSSFRVVLSKIEHWKAPSDKYYKDMIFGGYKYINNGILIVDTTIFTTDFPNDATSGNSFAKILGGLRYPFIEKINAQVVDIIKGKLCHSEMALQIGPTGLPQLHWTLQNQEYYRQQSEGPKPLDFSIPTDIILTKQP